MSRLVCWLFGHRWVFAVGPEFFGRLLDGQPTIWCARCNPRGRVHA